MLSLLYHSKEKYVKALMKVNKNEYINEIDSKKELFEASKNLDPLTKLYTDTINTSISATTKHQYVNRAVV